MTMCRAPSWGEDGLPLESSTRSTASFGDTLAQIGLQSTDWVLRQVRRWRGIFDEQRPDIVIADYAPGAVLAARGRIPCLVSGVGFTVPPAKMRRFPRLHEGASPLYEEEDICAAVNSALSSLDAPPIAYLAEVLAGDIQCACTLPILDPYDAFRSEPVLGPQLGAPIVRHGDGAREVFCYLREAPGASRLDEIGRCLGQLPGPVVAFIPGLAEDSKLYLSRQGVTLLDRPASLSTQLQRCRLVVHFGGHGIAAASFLAGVPQVILDFDIEKLLIATALTRRGVARHFDYYSASTELIVSEILAGLRDSEQLEAADIAAEEHERYRNRDVAADIATTCERMVV
jgi:hypothetical protein